MQSNVSLRDLREEDILILMEYWYGQPEFIASLGVDLAKLIPRTEREVQLKDLCQKIKTDNSFKAPVLAIDIGGKAIGMHSVNPLTPGEEGIFHAHIFDKSLRGREIAVYTYPRAAKIFMDR